MYQTKHLINSDNILCYALHIKLTTSIFFFREQTPEELIKGAKPLNKGNIYITTTSSPIVFKAYLEQFQRDFSFFLKSRSDELKVGGIMVLTFQGREKAHEITHPLVVIGMLLKDMILEVIDLLKFDYHWYRISRN